MRKWSAVLMILLGSFVRTMAQPYTNNAWTDSPTAKNLARLRSMAPDTNRVDLLLRMGGYYIFKNGEAKSDLDSAMIFLNQALQLGNSLHAVKWINETQKLRGDCYLEGKDLERGKACFRQVTDYYHKVGDSIREGLTWSRLGDCISWKIENGSQERMMCYVRAVALLPPDVDLGRQMLKLGEYYTNKPGEYTSDLDSAMSYIERAMQIALSFHNTDLQITILKAQGDCYMERSDLVHGKGCYVHVIDYYRRTGNKKEQAETWETLGRSIHNNIAKSNDESIKSYQQAYALFIEIQDTVRAVSTLERIANEHIAQGKTVLAEHEFLQILDHARNNYDVMELTYSSLAELSSLKGDMNKELYYRLEYVKLIEKTGDTANAPAYYGLGATYVRLGLHDKALFYDLKAREILRKQGSHEAFSTLDLNCVMDLVHLNRPLDALAMVEKSTKEVPPVSLQQKECVAESYGRIYAALKQNDKAEASYLEMKRISELLNGKQQGVTDVMRCYKILGDFYLQTSQYKKSIANFGKLAEYPLTAFTPMARGQIEEARFKADSAVGNYASAIRHFQRFKVLNDSVFTTTKAKQVDELQIKYETNRKDKDLQLQAKNIQLLTEQTRSQQIQMEKTRVTRNAVVGGSCVLLLLLGVSYNRYRLKKRSNLRLQAQQYEISAKNTELQQLLRDNQWLLREVHHRVKNNLQIVMSLLSSQSSYLQDEIALNAVMVSQHRVQAMSLIHQKLYKAETVSSIYMPEYISDLVLYLKDSFNTRQSVYFRQQIEEIKLDVIQAVPVGLILNEVITNCLKYAFADTGGNTDSTNNIVSITLACSDDDSISLQISDNGRGLPPGFDTDQQNSFGMVLIRGLTEDLAGSFEMESRNGTSIRIRFKRIAGSHAIQLN